MKGFIIFNNNNGNLVYVQYFTESGKLSKEEGYQNMCFDYHDPLKIANQLFAMIKMTEMVAEEYKDEYPEDLETDPNARMAFKSGFKSYKSDSVDYFLEHNDEFPLTLVLFF